MIPYRKKIRNYVPKAFMVTPTHVLCSNFTEIGRRELSETMCCFVHKKVQRVRFFAAWRTAPKVCYLSAKKYQNWWKCDEALTKTILHSLLGHDVHYNRNY